MKNLDFKNKRVLMRVDFNVPIDANHQVTDDTRIRLALPTIKKVLEGGASIVLMAHLGRPQKKRLPDGSIDVDKFSLRPVAGYLSKVLGTEVKFCPETVGEKAEAMANALKPGEIMMVENTRFDPGEEKGDEELAKKMARLGDIYINDAFGAAHRAHASTAVVARFFPKEARSFGLLMESELNNAKKLLDEPEHPFTAVVGGAKVSDKILLLERFLDLVDHIIIGGGMAYTFIKAQGGRIGNSLVEEDRIGTASELLKKAEEKGVQIHLPEDSVVAPEFADTPNWKVVPSNDIPDGYMGLDIGEKARKAFSEVILQSKTIVWNGPMGVFEMSNFANGTKAIAQAVAEATQNGAYSLIGGGDSVAAINQMGLADKVSFVSTGGGAMLELLEGKELPGVKAILD
ncbi:MAG: phosphoglycerate kinase [Saprospirales bacterium]|nr:phosphoglycerate kinase [Saprospirales bacterium]